MTAERQGPISSPPGSEPETTSRGRDVEKRPGKGKKAWLGHPVQDLLAIPVPRPDQKAEVIQALLTPTRWPVRCAADSWVLSFGEYRPFQHSDLEASKASPGMIPSSTLWVLPVGYRSLRSWSSGDPQKMRYFIRSSVGLDPVTQQLRYELTMGRSNQTCVGTSLLSVVKAFEAKLKWKLSATVDLGWFFLMDLPAVGVAVKSSQTEFLDQVASLRHGPQDLKQDKAVGPVSDRRDGASTPLLAGESVLGGGQRGVQSSSTVAVATQESPGPATPDYEPGSRRVEQGAVQKTHSVAILTRGREQIASGDKGKVEEPSKVKGKGQGGGEDGRGVRPTSPSPTSPLPGSVRPVPLRPALLVRLRTGFRYLPVKIFPHWCILKLGKLDPGDSAGHTATMLFPVGYQVLYFPGRTRRNLVRVKPGRSMAGHIDAEAIRCTVRRGQGNQAESTPLRTGLRPSSVSGSGSAPSSSESGDLVFELADSFNSLRTASSLSSPFLQSFIEISPPFQDVESVPDPSELFGFRNPAIQLILQSLPGSSACTQYKPVWHRALGQSVSLAPTMLQVEPPEQDQHRGKKGSGRGGSDGRGGRQDSQDDADDRGAVDSSPGSTKTLTKQQHLSQLEPEVAATGATSHAKGTAASGPTPHQAVPSPASHPAQAPLRSGAWTPSKASSGQSMSSLATKLPAAVDCAPDPAEAVTSEPVEGPVKSGGTAGLLEEAVGQLKSGTDGRVSGRRQVSARAGGGVSLVSPSGPDPESGSTDAISGDIAASLVARHHAWLARRFPGRAPRVSVVDEGTKLLLGCDSENKLQLPLTLGVGVWDPASEASLVTLHSLGILCPEVSNTYGPNILVPVGYCVSRMVPLASAVVSGSSPGAATAATTSPVTEAGRGFPYPRSHAPSYPLPHPIPPYHLRILFETVVASDSPTIEFRAVVDPSSMPQPVVKEERPLPSLTPHSGLHPDSLQVRSHDRGEMRTHCQRSRHDPSSLDTTVSSDSAPSTLESTSESHPDASPVLSGSYESDRLGTGPGARFPTRDRTRTHPDTRAYGNFDSGEDTGVDVRGSDSGGRSVDGAMPDSGVGGAERGEGANQSVSIGEPSQSSVAGRWSRFPRQTVRSGFGGVGTLPIPFGWSAPTVGGLIRVMSAAMAQYVPPHILMSWRQYLGSDSDGLGLLGLDRPLIQILVQELCGAPSATAYRPVCLQVPIRSPAVGPLVALALALGRASVSSTEPYGTVRGFALGPVGSRKTLVAVADKDGGDGEAPATAVPQTRALPSHRPSLPGGPPSLLVSGSGWPRRRNADEFWLPIRLSLGQLVLSVGGLVSEGAGSHTRDLLVPVGYHALVRCCHRSRRTGKLATRENVYLFSTQSGYRGPHHQVWFVVTRLASGHRGQPTIASSASSCVATRGATMDEAFEPHLATAADGGPAEWVSGTVLSGLLDPILTALLQILAGSKLVALPLYRQRVLTLSPPELALGAASAALSPQHQPQGQTQQPYPQIHPSGVWADEASWRSMDSPALGFGVEGGLRGPSSSALPMAGNGFASGFSSPLSLVSGPRLPQPTLRIGSGPEARSLSFARAVVCSGGIRIGRAGLLGYGDEAAPMVDYPPALATLGPLTSERLDQFILSLPAEVRHPVPPPWLVPPALWDVPWDPLALDCLVQPPLPVLVQLAPDMFDSHGETILPLRVNSTLILEKLGQITSHECVFRDPWCIFPVGFQVTRRLLGPKMRSADGSPGLGAGADGVGTATGTSGGPGMGSGSSSSPSKGHRTLLGQYQCSIGATVGPHGGRDLEFQVYNCLTGELTSGRDCIEPLRASGLLPAQLPCLPRLLQLLPGIWAQHPPSSLHQLFYTVLAQWFFGLSHPLIVYLLQRLARPFRSPKSFRTSCLSSNPSLLPEGLFRSWVTAPQGPICPSLLCGSSDGGTGLVSGHEHRVGGPNFLEQRFTPVPLLPRPKLKQPPQPSPPPRQVQSARGRQARARSSRYMPATKTAASVSVGRGQAWRRRPLLQDQRLRPRLGRSGRGARGRGEVQRPPTSAVTSAASRIRSCRATQAHLRRGQPSVTGTSENTQPQSRRRTRDERHKASTPSSSPDRSIPESVSTLESTSTSVSSEPPASTASASAAAQGRTPHKALRSTAQSGQVRQVQSPPVTGVGPERSPAAGGAPPASATSPPSKRPAVGAAAAPALTPTAAKSTAEARTEAGAGGRAGSQASPIPSVRGPSALVQRLSQARRHIWSGPSQPLDSDILKDPQVAELFTLGPDTLAHAKRHHVVKVSHLGQNHDGTVRFPIQLAPTLVLERLGWIVPHRAFQRRSFVMPVGWRSIRMVELGQHHRLELLCEVLFQKPRSVPVPLFRIKTLAPIDRLGRVAVEAPVLLEVVQKLVSVMGWSSPISLSPKRLFGFDLPLTKYLLQSMPGLSQCTIYTPMRFQLPKLPGQPGVQLGPAKLPLDAFGPLTFPAEYLWLPANTRIGKPQNRSKRKAAASAAAATAQRTETEQHHPSRSPGPSVAAATDPATLLAKPAQPTPNATPPVSGEPLTSGAGAVPAPATRGRATKETKVGPSSPAAPEGNQPQKGTTKTGRSSKLNGRSKAGGGRGRRGQAADPEPPKPLTRWKPGSGRRLTRSKLRQIHPDDRRAILVFSSDDSTERSDSSISTDGTKAGPDAGTSSDDDSEGSSSSSGSYTPPLSWIARIFANSAAQPGKTQRTRKVPLRGSTGAKAPSTSTSAAKTASEPASESGPSAFPRTQSEATQDHASKPDLLPASQTTAPSRAPLASPSEPASKVQAS